MSVILIGTLVVVLAAVCLFTVWTYKLKKPSSGTCDIVKSIDPEIKWSIDCDYINEVAFDASITAPTVPLYLTSFTSSPSLGPAWGANVYFAYRYVNGKTGNYSNLSPWTPSPIHAGASATTLPCKGSNGCPVGFKNANKDSCQSNLPTLELDSSTYGPTSGYYINIHRYSTTLTDTKLPTDKTTGTLIGIMSPGTGGKYVYHDVSKSPCTETTCTNVPGC